MQTDTTIAPVAFLFNFTGDVGEGNAMPIGIYTEFQQGVPPGMPNSFFAEWRSPPFTPEVPIIVRVFSKSYVDMKSIERREFIFPLTGTLVPGPYQEPAAREP